MSEPIHSVVMKMPCLAGFLYIIILPIPMAINNPPNHLLLVPGRGEVLGFDE